MGRYVSVTRLGVDFCDSPHNVFNPDFKLIKHWIDIDPIPAPRMVRSDKWAKRPIVSRYFGYKTELRAKANISHFNLTDVLNCIFLVKFPDSYSKKKRDLLRNKPHQVMPDCDNYVKAMIDSFGVNDSYVWDIHATKVWSDKGGIIIY